MLSISRSILSLQALLLCLVTLVLSQQYAGETINNTLPVVPGANLTYYAIANPSGTAKQTLINYVSLNTKGGRAVGSNYKRAVIVIHGLNRDPQTYMANMLSALSQVPNSDVTPDSVAIMAPYFPNGNDKNVGYPWTTGLAAGAGSTSSALVWTGSNFADGANNTYPYKSKTVSSYEVVDQMIKYFSSPAFPNMKQIVVAGHSLGAQFTQRYAIMGKTLSVSPKVTYWIGNPNSFAWLTTDRPLDTSTCATYDVWRDGLTSYLVNSSYNAALYNQGRAAMLANYQSRSIGYGRATQDFGDDASSCAPYTTGQNRNERFFNFIKAFPPTCNGIGGCDTIDYVPVGHDAGSMFADPSGQARLFLDNFNGTGNRAYDFGYPRIQMGDDPYPNPAYNATNTTSEGLSGSYSGMTYVGCFVEQRQTLAYFAYDDANNTLERCTSTCASQQYTIAGLEYGTQCFCGNYLPAAAKQTIEQACTTPCSGNSSEICGNNLRLSIYSQGSPQILNTVATPTIGNYSLQGCYQDNNPGRALTAASYTSQNNMTLESCGAFCAGYAYFGAEYSSECYCGNSLNAGANTTPLSDCSMTCSGNASEYCGNGNRLSLYFNPNATTTASTSSSSDLVCPSANGQIYTAASNKTYQIECSVDHAGGDLSNSPATTLSQCIDICDATSGCVAYSWVATSNGNSAPCYLKSSIGYPNANSNVMGGKYVTNSTAASTTTISGTSTTTGLSTTATASSSALVCPSANGFIYTAASNKTYQIECSVDHNAGDLSVSYATTLSQCIENCDATNGCVAYSWVATSNGNNAPCYLKSSIGYPNSNSNVMGGKFVTNSTSVTTSSSSNSVSTVSSSAASSTATNPVLSCPASNGTVYNAPSGQNYQVECYNDHFAGDLSMKYADTLVGCINVCDSTAGCVAYSWVSNANGARSPCYMKSSIGANQVNSAVWGGKMIAIAAASTTASTTSSIVSSTSSSNASSIGSSTTSASTSTALTSATSTATLTAPSVPSTDSSFSSTASSTSPTNSTTATAAASTSTDLSTSSTTSSTSSSSTDSSTSSISSSISSTSSSTDSSTSFSSTTSSTPVATLSSNSQQLGCYADSGTSRTFSNRAYSNSSNTPAFCQQACSSQGFPYSGTEYSSECYCSMHAPKTTSTACNMACSGDKSQICGGPNALSVVQDNSVTVPTFVARTNYSTWSLVNCYVDSVNARTFPTRLNTNSSQTVSTCLDSCSAAGFAYCGLEYYTECYGSLTAPTAAVASGSDGTSDGVLAAGCNYACGGNSTESCGGANRLQVYMNNARLNSTSSSTGMKKIRGMTWA